jgi:copper oxidase (laccase) domain-containing protein
VALDGSSGALLHSGKKGTELGIVREGIHTLTERTRKEPDEFLAVVGPCIRPPCYEVDFAADIRKQALKAGITEIHDAGICTACHPERYYSYRREKGLTGRMLATLTLL